MKQSQKLFSPVRYLSGVGPVMAKKLEKLEIFTIYDLLLHLPFRYEDLSLVTKISKIQPGETVTIIGKVTNFKNVYTRNFKNIQKAVISDTNGNIRCLWFNQPFLNKIFIEGNDIAVAGKAVLTSQGLQLISPDYETIRPQQPLLHMGRLVPIYPETKGVSSKWLRSKIFIYLTVNTIEDFLDLNILQKYALIDLKQALIQCHFPLNLSQVEPVRERLSFDELLVVTLRSLIQRTAWQKRKQAIPMRIGNFEQDFKKMLPFTFTADQDTALAQILKDLQNNVPMNRLLCGDVGSGKTVVAAAAMYCTYQNKLKSMLMAPTEILAHQHYLTLQQMFARTALKIALVTGSKKNLYGSDWDILVGTHALLYQQQNYQQLGLVVIDEQHRFGVLQRSILREKAGNPHVLTMTATPIPRTMALTLYRK